MSSGAKVVAEYGTWKSPLSSVVVTKSGVQVLEVRTDLNPAYTDCVYWLEQRPSEGGRGVIRSQNLSDNSKTEWTPSGFNARTTVHEYGGGVFFVYSGAVYFTNFSDQLLYRQDSPSAAPVPVFSQPEGRAQRRVADGIFSAKKERIYAVCEDHEPVKAKTAKEPENFICTINPATQSLDKLVSGHDFFSSPRVSADGKYIAWVQWDHPNMPWDDTELYIAQLSESGDSIVEGSMKKVAGGKDVSVMLPCWTPEGDLLFVSDEKEWWNLYRLQVAAEPDAPCQCVLQREQELGGPQWQLGRAAYCCAGSQRVVTSYGGELGLLNLQTRTLEPLTTGFRLHSNICMAGERVCCLASSPVQFPTVIALSPASPQDLTVVLRSQEKVCDEEHFSIPEEISYPTSEGDTAHAFYYPPANKDFEAPAGTLPPLLVRAHGGPTSAYSCELNLRQQYFTNRGFAVLTVNYRGSTGHGRTYRQKLRNKWGIYDVEDCCHGALYLAKEGKVREDGLCIDGGSAGGYTTLACLTFKDVFKVGASHYGIGDLEALVSDTHKFESRYPDNLIAPATEEGRKILKERSPIHFVDRLNCPMVIFQGDEDKIVPPNQATTMYQAVKAKGLPCCLVMFEGEQHGFRKAENIQKALDGEFYFFARVLGFQPADNACQLEIDNLD